MAEISDGLEALRRVMSLREIASFIERTAQWVAPETFKLLPLWFPEHARRGLFYKRNWSEPQMNKSRATGHSVHKSEGNVNANEALTLALGLKRNSVPTGHVAISGESMIPLINSRMSSLWTAVSFRAWAIWFCCRRRSKPSLTLCPKSKRCCEFAPAISTGGSAITIICLRRTLRLMTGWTGKLTQKAGPRCRMKSCPLAWWDYPQRFEHPRRSA